MTDTDQQPSDAVRMARDNAFANGVTFGALEWLQIRVTPSLRARYRWEMLLGALKAVAMIMPPAALLLPLGGGLTAQMMSGEGFLGDDLRVMVTITFWLGAIGQAWVLLDWWRRGRERDGTAIATGVLALLAAAVAVPWFSRMLPPDAIASVLVPIVVTGLLAAAVLVAHLAMSRPTDRHRAELERAALVQALPADEQRVLLEERTLILQELQRRSLIDAARAEHARALPVGEWFRLDQEAPAKA